MADQQVQETDWRFSPEIDRLWDALTKRGMHYDRESMEHDEPGLANRHRASLALALDEGGWVPRSEAEALADALDGVTRRDRPLLFIEARRALNVYRSRHPKGTP